MKSYITVMREAADEVIINKSRFIGRAAPVHTPEEALSFLARVRAAHPDATHNCYAYIIGENAGIMRYSDDGEPGGTAGMPIIEVMKNRHVVDCAVVVTRYFGGVLLGAGGLVRAYTKGCVLALNAAGLCEMFPTESWLCEVPYPLWDKVQHTLKALPVRLKDTDFGAAVNFTLEVKTTDSDTVRQVLTQSTDARMEMLREGEECMAWEIPE